MSLSSRELRRVGVLACLACCVPLLVPALGIAAGTAAWFAVGILGPLAVALGLAWWTTRRRVRRQT